MSFKSAMNLFAARRFTLLELLLVVATIALLASLAMPALRRAQVSARRIACASNLRQIGIGLRLYLDESRNIMPPAAMKPSLGLDDKRPITHYITLDSPDVFLCPAEPGNFFREETTSYEYNSLLGGFSMNDSFIAGNLKLRESDLHVMYDFEPFHGEAKIPGAKNYLYVDGRVGDFAAR